ncbi:hypothetical protein CANARDRAFT_26349 [[Candida] arabinofermentans NRRL YB-2248]|uniref:rRNA biogenesis protein RRP5 n=1 Tax=[Candida] arabinofermentans NRRL YB-2248 TaxID=983967 RepID=A0A1E4T8X3_9ASCO|nr:hypothetical protein CANARDRAFT_26349 [[Candida] arabinofermentans NRRL YB-2248]
MVEPQKRKRSEEDSGKPSIGSTKSLLTQTAETSFPRGGASLLTPLEVKEIANEAARDVLFEAKNAEDAEAPAVKKAKKSKKSKSSTSTTATSSEGQTITVDHLSFKNLLPGSMVLGQIKRINRMEIILSLPDNLDGYIPITSISEELTKELQDFDDEQNESDDDDDEEMKYDTDDEESENKITKAITAHKEKKSFPDLRSRFQVGQWLRAAVVESSSKTTKKASRTKKRIELTIEPSKVNSGMDEDEDLIVNSIIQVSVKSVEDHGAILNVGFEKFNGFISNKELSTELYSPEKLNVGSVLLVAIAKKNQRTITCKIPTGSAKKQPSVQTISSIDSIIPGMIVDALITDVVKEGLVCKVFGLCNASINFTHLGTYDLTEMKHKFAVGSSIRARIIASFMRAGDRRLQLSTLPHLQTFQQYGYNKDIQSAPLEAFPIGHIFETVTIKGKDSSYIYADVGVESILGQAHTSRTSDQSDIDMDFKIGSTHKARVLGYSQVDNMYILTLDKKQIDQAFLRVEDIPIGSLVNGEVLKVITDKGLVLKISEAFEAFVPSTHMSDVKLIYPERKFKIGSKVKGRVLRIVNTGGKSSITVTLKKSLVNIEDEEVVASIEDAEVGKRTPATIEKFQPNGCIVSFFGTVKAFLPNAEISETFVKKPEDHVKLGQTAKVRILTVDKEKRRVKVSLRVSDALSESQKKAMTLLVPGRSVVKVQVVEKEKDSVVVELVESNLRGVIFSGQLGDGNYEQCRAILKKLSAGSELEALVLEKDVRTRLVKLSTKPSLIESARNETLPTSYKDISVNSSEIPGYVKSVTNNGVFVAFANNLSGLVLPRYASETPIENLQSAFIQHQSVLCHVIRVDDANKRFLLSLKKGNDESVAEAALNPADKSIKLLSDFVPGKITKAQIKSIKGTQLNVQLADNQQGRIDITQLFDSFDDIKDPKRPLAQFSYGDILDVKVIGFHDARNHRFLPITHKRTKQTILELSARKQDLVPESKVVPTSIGDLKEGDSCVAYINNFARGFLWVSISISLKGRVSLMDLSNDASTFDNLEKDYPVGCALKVKVSSIDTEHNMLTLSARSKPIKSIDDVKVGDVIPVRVSKTRESYVVVELGSNVTAVSFITDALNDYSDKLDDIFSTNDICAATVLEIDTPNNKVYVSLRTKDAKDKQINSVEDLKRGDIVRGFVKNVANNGVYVALSRGVHALVRITDLSDSFLKEWKQFFKVHQPVLGKVLKADEEGRVLMTLKDSEVNGDLNILKRFEDIKTGEIYEGSVRKVTDFGVFVKLDGTINVTGLCHHSEISDNPVENIQNIFGEGDRVKVKIMAVDQEKKQLSLGMKASYFSTGKKAASAADEDEDVEMEDADSEEDDEEVGAAESDSDDEDAMVDGAYADESDESDDNSEFSDEVKNSESAFSAGLSTDFDWTASILEQAKEEESSDDDDFENETGSKRKKKKSTKLAEDKTAEIATRAPQSTSDFERLLIGNPNSSILWMNYMSFQLQLSEIERARELGERALKTINYREEQEKMNIWIAMLNLENMFGSEESLEEVFKRSCQYMDSFVMHQKLVAIYITSEKYDSAEELYNVMTKKFGSQHVSVWVAYGSFMLERQQSEKAHQILARSLQILPKRDHVECVKKFAQLEFAKGDPEQGRSLFEGLLSDVPKRIDLWNVYIDQEIKLGEKKKAEALLERVVTKKLSRKQAKFFFGKWLAYEEKHDDEKAADYVKAKAAEYAQRLSEKN